jgi:hypothetical protein
MDFIKTLGNLGQKQRVRLTFDDGTTIETRVNQSVYTPGENLRLELASEQPQKYQRYRIRAHVEGDTWNPVHGEGYDTEKKTWTDFGKLTNVTPMETYRTSKSSDMEAQENTSDGELEKDRSDA